MPEGMVSRNTSTNVQKDLMLLQKIFFEKNILSMDSHSVDSRPDCTVCASSLAVNVNFVYKTDAFVGRFLLYGHILGNFLFLMQPVRY